MKLAVAFASLTLAAQVPHQMQHPPGSAEEYAKILEDPSRHDWQKPQEVIDALGLKPTDIVADIGAGSGYFARRFAKKVATVYAVDIDANLLKIAASAGEPNLKTIHASPNDPKLPKASVDLIFFCDVLHHIENRPAYFRKLEKALKPGGRIVNVDFYKKELPVGPPLAMKLTEAQVAEEFIEAGFVLSRRIMILPYQYFQIFVKR